MSEEEMVVRLGPKFFVGDIIEFRGEKYKVIKIEREPISENVVLVLQREAGQTPVRHENE